MNEQSQSTGDSRVYSPLGQLILARVREFYREPEAVFWVYGFPVLIVVALGIAFRNRPIERINIYIEAGPEASRVQEELSRDARFVTQISDASTCRVRLRTGKGDLIIVAPHERNGEYQYFFDRTRPESVLARNAVNDWLQVAAGRKDPLAVVDNDLEEPGGRYIDFLVPGLVGMSLMGGGLWGVGFVTVDMRIRKLLKRFLATPMKKSNFLEAIMISRLLFLIPEMIFLLVFARLVFGVKIQGSITAVVLLILLGAITFAGIGLLVASRARTIEAVSGWMNLVMLPMWVLSGIFFSSDRFPEAVQPFIKTLPLTQLIDALRAVMQEGAALQTQLLPVSVLVAWGIISFVLALRWFRWQ